MRKLLLTAVLSIMTVICYSQNPQPEYTSYEDISATDMVSLITGDLTYTLPILEVPGPEGNFALPISYHSGIKNNELSSWVGLGWSLNCGAINRQVSRYPDDFSGQTIYNNLQNPGGKDYSKSWIVYTEFTYNNGKNKGGSVGLGSILGYSWGKSRSMEVIGINFNFNQGNFKDTKAEDVVLGIVEAAAFLVDKGIIASTSQAAEAIGVASNITNVYSKVQSLGMIASTFSDYSSNSELWESKTRYRWFNDWCLLKTENRYYLNTGVAENVYGILNFDKIPKSSRGTHSRNFFKEDESTPLFNDNSWGQPDEVFMKYPNTVTSDYHMYIDDDVEYQWSMNPTSLTPDNYIVMGSGVSGTIEPYRFETCNIVPSSFGSLYNEKGGLNTFLSYKVPFIYKGAYSNYYYNQIGEDQTLPASDLINQFGIEISTATCQGPLKYIVKDATIYDGVGRKETDRLGLRNNRFVSGNYVEWYTNDEIKSGSAFNGSFLDFTLNTETFRTECAKQVDNSPSNQTTTYYWDGIGGFAITRNDGMTYHYALPVYNLEEFSYTENKVPNLPNTVTKSSNKNKFAIHWLLTAITGPDFIDRNNNHVADDYDWGYWVKFDYKKHENYSVRNPSAGYFYSNDGKSFGYSSSLRETYYLSTIQTRTHVAYFIKSPRQDGYGFERRDNPSLRLDDIYLMKRDDYSSLLDLYYPDLSAFEKGSGNSSILNYLAQIQLRRIHFDYDYSLCMGAYTNFSGGGKLTLKTITTLYKNNFRAIPPYIFEYSSNNPNFNSENYDYWGMYNRNGAANRLANNNGDEWLLTKIVTPVGSEVNFIYERDDYSSVSGYDTPQKKGGDSRVSQIQVRDNSGNSIETKYLYNRAGSGISSGVCSLEPEGAKSNIELYISKKKQIQSYDYPATPIMYSHVTVLRDNFKSKEEYDFVTPHVDMVNWRSQAIKDQTLQCNSIDEIKAYNYFIELNTSKIGAIKSIKKYYNNMLTTKQEFFYDGANQLGQGVFTESSLLFEDILNRDNENWNTDRLFKTTKVFYPNVLKRIETTSNGASLITKNEVFDFFTGVALSVSTTKNNSDVYNTEIIPAYNIGIYSAMGSKVNDLKNKNMLTQEAASFTKKLINSEWKIIDASVQTWNNEWNYRNYDGINYSDPPSSDPNRVWRKFGSYVWKGEVNPDGTYKDFPQSSNPSEIKLNWTNLFAGAGIAGWLRESVITRYNHLSVPIESWDINGNYASAKFDCFNKYLIAKAVNANYNSFSYCGFENHDINVWDGEFLGSCSQIAGTKTFPAHSGAFYGSFTGERSPEFKINIGGYYGLLKNRSYRAMVWMHKSTPDDAMLVITTDNSTPKTKLKNASDNKTFGDWILVTQDISSDAINLANTLSIYVSIANPITGRPVIIDDIRVQAIDAFVVAYNYDNNGNLSSTLDNNNFATKFEYDVTGRLISSFKETPNGFKKVSENKYNYKRSTYPVGFTVTGNPSYGVPLTFTAFDAGTNVASDYQWNFGNGTTAQGKSVVTTFSGYDDGEEEVTLTVKAADGKTETAVKKIQVKDNSTIYISHPYTNQVFQGTGFEIDINWSGYQGPVDIKVLHNGEITSIGYGETGGNVKWAIPSSTGLYVITIESSLFGDNKSAQVSFYVE